MCLHQQQHRLGCLPPGCPPLLTLSLPPAAEAAYGALLAPYLADPSNLFIVSSDFCHWGRRFGYTAYDPAEVRGEHAAAGQGARQGKARLQCRKRGRALRLARRPQHPAVPPTVPTAALRAPSTPVSRRWTGGAWR